LTSVANDDGSVTVDEVRAGLRWRAIPGGWRLSAPLLQMTSGSRSDQLDGLALQVGPRVSLSLVNARIGVLTSLASLSPVLPDSLRQWLLKAAPHAQVVAMQVDGAPDGALRGSATLNSLGFEPVSGSPALDGLAGTLRFDRDGLLFDLDSSTSTLNWPAEFEASVPLQLHGSLAAWREGAGWTLGGSDLRLHNDEIDLRAALSLQFASDGSKPRLDLAAILGHADLRNAHHYWLRHNMSAASVKWLDAGLVKGNLVGANVLVGGDLDDWPFLQHQGLFEGVALLDDATVKFLPDWPPAEHLRGRASFINDGMRFAGSASLAGIAVPVVRQEIPHFPEPMLSVEAQASSSGSQLLALLRASPLQKQFADTFNALTIDGPARTHFELAQPLRPGMPGHSLLGTVDLDHAKLADSRWNLHFTDATGQVRVDQDGLSVHAMQVKVDGDPAQFELGIGQASGEAATAVNATLAGNFLAANLIARAPSLDWLKPLLVGRSAWTVNVRVPKAVASASPAVLRLRSDLRGTRLALPVPLDKPAEQALPMMVEVPLPTSAGEIRVQLGDLLHVRGRVSDTQPFHGVLAFGGESGATLPAKGIVLSGRAPAIAVGDWIAYVGGGEGAGSALNSIDVQTASLDLLNTSLGAARVRMLKQAASTSFLVDGPNIAGSVQIPNQIAQGIKGNFARLYWPRSPDVMTSAASAVPTTVNPSAIEVAALTNNSSDANATNPANVPPLHLEIVELRYGDARLGRTVLDTQPSPQGMHIRQFQTQSPAQTINASGDWTGRGRSARTSLAILFSADSLGDMLDALGFEGVVAGGKTRAKLVASWTGAPAAFALARLDGQLEVDVGKGRLLEVKPGAGRILGLVSLAAIPRRLGLDFRDFFDKGFSFDTIAGHFSFGDGKARTADLKIKGPAAEIKITGSADLIAQTYDQMIEVTPRTSGVITAVGAIAGGPVGAAIGAAAQALLKKPLGKLTRKRYHVTGPWKNPDVQPVSAGKYEPSSETASKTH
ncbi:MAG: YhdP family protein, partial [Lysobacteraceae bacterium]